jgi:hypothetical protein
VRTRFGTELSLGQMPGVGTRITATIDINIQVGYLLAVVEVKRQGLAI